MRLNTNYPICRAFALYVEKHCDQSDYFEYQYNGYTLSAKRHSFNFWDFNLLQNGKVIYKNFSPNEFGYIVEIDDALVHLEAAE